MSEESADNKDLRNISLLVPKNFGIFKPDIEIFLKKDEEIIEKYIEKTIYTSTLPSNIKNKMNTIFTNVKKQILNSI
jgi:hypothetical protein